MWKNFHSFKFCFFVFFLNLKGLLFSDSCVGFFFFRWTCVIYLMDEWNISSAMPGYHSLGGGKMTKKHKTNCQLFCCFEQLQLNREHSNRPDKCMHRLQVSIPVFISESLTFPRHLLTFVDTCKQQGVSISKEKQWKENSDGQMSTGYGHLLLWLQHWALKCTVGQWSQWSPLLCSRVQSMK